MSLAAEADNLALNYFTTTLGQAAQHPTTPFTTVNELIAQQAQNNGEKLACGWPSPGETASEWACKLFSTYTRDFMGFLLVCTYSFAAFDDLFRGSLAAAKVLKKYLANSGDGESRKQCVALLCASSIDFLFAWLGLMRAGFSVLLIA